MFSIRDVESSDLPEVYGFTVKLLRHHVGPSGQSSLPESELVTLFQNGFLKGLLLVRTSTEQLNSNKLESADRTSQAVGFMIFHADISLLRGGRGICLDQFYIEPEYRKLGLGRKMMSVLCNRVLTANGNYIKIIYQDGLGLDVVYGKMGFVNHSRGDAGVHLFEAYGKAKLEEFINRFEKKPPTDTKKIRVMVLPFSRAPIDLIPDAALPVWSAISGSSLDDTTTGHSMLPEAHLVIVAEAGSCHSQAKPTNPDTGLLSRYNSRLCMFIEQSCICCWLGPMVNFADFVGDTSILDPYIFYKRLRSCSLVSSKIRGAAWEVPTQSCTDDGAINSSQSLASKLRDHHVTDYTHIEGWNIAYLDVTGMRKLSQPT